MFYAFKNSYGLICVDLVLDDVIKISCSCTVKLMYDSNQI